jgi:hypothetical protein
LTGPQTNVTAQSLRAHSQCRVHPGRLAAHRAAEARCFPLSGSRLAADDTR